MPNNKNRNPQAHHLPSDYVTNLERLDAKDAIKFADTIGCPLNLYMECVLPSIEDPIHRLEYGRAISHKVRMFMQQKEINCCFISARYADPAQPNVETISYLVHVPERYQALFRSTVAKWTDGITVSDVVTDQTVQPDRKIYNTFNSMFSALAPETQELETTAPYRKSGRLYGPRVFVTRNLWLRRRIDHRDFAARVKAGKVGDLVD